MTGRAAEFADLARATSAYAPIRLVGREFQDGAWVHVPGLDTPPGLPAPPFGGTSRHPDSFGLGSRTALR